MIKALALAFLLFVTAAPMSAAVTVPSSQAQFLGLTWTPTSITELRTASITFTATIGSANGLTVVAATAGKTIVVFGYTISTDTQGTLNLHHGYGAATLSNLASNLLGGGFFAAGGGESKDFYTGRPGTAVNQPVCIDIGQAVGYFLVTVFYKLVS